jgi:DNA-directed RNA polymerase subunit H (RpoH/RPB5)
MKKTEKINRSRYTLKEILSNEWDTSTIMDYSDAEIEKMYFNSDNPFVNTFGFGFNCNIILNHKQISNYRLLILYVNFKDNDKKSQKLNDTIRDKINGGNSLYSNNYINPCDSIMVIVDEKISESIEKYISTLNIELKTDLDQQGLTQEIKDEMASQNIELDKELSLKHFKNVNIINIDSITNNLFKHSLIPKHRVVRNKEEIDNILNKCNCNINQLPIILKTDIMSKLNRISPGDIVEITRKSLKSGEYPFYRVCK